MSDTQWTVAKSKDRVVTSTGVPIGTVKSVRNNHIEVGHARLWLPGTAVASRDDKVVRLGRDYDFLVESGTAERSGGPVGKLLGLLTLGGAIVAAIIAFQNKKRSKASQDRLSPTIMQAPTPTGASSSVPSEKSEFPKDSLTTPEALEESSAGLELPPFAALDLSDRVVTETEQEVIERVSRAFPARSLQVNAIGVHTLEGGDVGTRRFTLDDVASSDLALNRLQTPQASASSLALEVIEVQTQLPPDPA